MISLVLFISGRDGSNKIDTTIFKLTDPKAVDHVTIEKIGEKVDLKFSNGSWNISFNNVTQVDDNGLWPADRDLIDVLFATMEQAIPKRKVASRLQDSVVNQISKEGIRISFFSNGNREKIISVFGNEALGITYFLKDGDVSPYLMAIPGYRVYVAGIFEQAANSWRDKRIFNFNWRNFESLSAEFPSQPKQNFKVAMTGRYFSIVGEDKIDTTALNDYLDAVSLIGADAFYEPGESNTIDSVNRSVPIMIISVKDVGGQIYSLKLFQMSKSQDNILALWRNGIVESVLKVGVDSESLGDFVWFDRRNIFRLRKMKKDFIK